MCFPSLIGRVPIGIDDTREVPGTPDLFRPMAIQDRLFGGNWVPDKVPANISRASRPRSDAGAYPGVSVPNPAPVARAPVIGRGRIVAVGIVIGCGERAPDDRTGGKAADTPTPAAVPASSSVPTAAVPVGVCRTRRGHGRSSKSGHRGESNQNLFHDITSMIGVRIHSAPRCLKFPFPGEWRLNVYARIPPSLRLGTRQGEP